MGSGSVVRPNRLWLPSVWSGGPNRRPSGGGTSSMASSGTCPHVFNGEEFYWVGKESGVGGGKENVQLHAVRHADVVIVRPEGLAAFFHQLFKAWVVHLHRNGGGSFDVA